MDRETIFPLQAVAGYAMVRGLFQHRKNILVEGLSDYLYLHALNQYCRELNRQCLQEDVYITPCGGTKHVGHIASLFLGQNVRPVVLLDGDDAGRVRKNALMKELYAGYESSVLVLSDVLKKDDCEIEDIIGEVTILDALRSLSPELGNLNLQDHHEGSLITRIKDAANKQGIRLPEGWKANIARQIVVSWSELNSKDIPMDVLDRAEALFKELAKRF